MNFKLFLISFLLSNIVSQAQELSDKFKYKATYELTWQIDSTDAESVQSETMLLFLGEKTSRFSSEGQHIRDSIQSVYKEREKTPQSFSEMRSKMPNTAFEYYILKEFASKDIIYKEKVFKEYYEYSEDLTDMQWAIMQESDTISGFNVQKATTNFAGRNYTAWFTSEVPISDGPYKFKGLPGLIIQIADENNYYVFNLMGVKTLNDPIFDIGNKEDYLKTDKTRLREIKKEFDENPFAKMEESGMSFGFKPGQREKMMKERREELKKKNNPIELE